MIKECPVILNNEEITAVKYNETIVQFPSIKRDVKTILVEYKNGKYFVVDENANNSTSISKTKKRGRKKKTVVVDQEEETKANSTID